MRVESANSGRPESPPDSLAVLASCKPGGRATVVLPTIMPSTRRRRAAPTTSSSSLKVRSGAILMRSGVRPGLPAHARARVDHAGEQIVEQLALLQVAQAGRVGRRDVDREVARHRREGLDQAHIVGDAVGAVLVGPHIDPDQAAGAGARRQPRQHRLRAFAVEAEPVDDALVGRQPEQARARIAGLRPRRHGADLDEAEAEPQQRVRHLAMLVEAGRHADRIGKIEAEDPHRKPRSSAGAGPRGTSLEALDGQPMGVLGIHEAQQRPGQAVEQADHGASSGKTWRPSAPKGSGTAHSTASSDSAP